MKKRIIALVLVVVMTVLSLASCGSYNFVKEDLNQYASFDYAAFKTALQKLEIEDGSFTSDENTRITKTIQSIYTKIADAIIAATEEADRKESGKINNNSDVLYYVYRAVDENGNVFFTSEMKESAITAASTAADHVIKLGAVDVNDKDADEIEKLIKQNLLEDVDLADYVYSMLVASDIEKKVKDSDETKALREEAEKKYKEENPEATDAQVSAEGDKAVNAAVAAALKVKEGDKIVLSYTRTKNTSEEGVVTTVTEKAELETIVLDGENKFHQMFLAEGSVAKVGSKLEVKDPDDSTKTTQTFDVEMDGVKYTYSEVDIKWIVETEGNYIATFEYTFDDEKDKKVVPNNIRKVTTDDNGAINLKGKKVTYYVYPVYAISVDEIVRNENKDEDNVIVNSETVAANILTWITGKALNDESFEIFEEDGYVYKEEGKDDVKLADLIKEIVSIYTPTETDNKYYKEGEELQKLNKDYTDKKAISDKSGSTTAQKNATSEALTALNKKQREVAAEFVTKIANAVKGEEKLAAKIVEEYYDSIFHSLKETYDSDIVKKVQKAVWELITTSVKVNKDKLPEKLVKEYKDHLIDTYEYNYYKGQDSGKQAYYDKYSSFEAYLISKDALDISSVSMIDSAIEDEAKSYLEPIVQIYVVSKACEADALKVVKNYIELDKKQGAYDIDEESYKETYGDKAAAKIEEAKKNAKESYEQAIEDAKKFLIDDAYIDDYKREIGSAYYRQLVNDYGEINLRVSFQFNKLFYYLTSTNVVKSEEGGHHHTEVDYDDKGLIDFRTVSYGFKAEDSDEADD